MNIDEKLIVIGASAGGIDALFRLAAGLDPTLPAAISLVLHISPDAPRTFARTLSGKGPIPADFAHDGDQVEKGRIFIAPPDRHLVVSDGRYRLLRTPRENWTRPAIDPLFRSAAAYYSTRAIGVILSGTMDDGTSGFRAIKRCGGTTVAQDPAEAIFPDMPQNAISSGSTDHVVRMDAMPRLLWELASAPAPEQGAVPQEIMQEVTFLEQGGVAFDYKAGGWNETHMICPDCGGPLWSREDAGYGCTIGHRFGPISLMAAQDVSVEQSLWSALRMMHERIHVLTSLADDALRRGAATLAADYRQKADELQRHERSLKDLLHHAPVDVKATASSSTDRDERKGPHGNS